MLGTGYVQAKSAEQPSLNIVNHHDQEKIHGRSIKLVLKLTPSPDHSHPIHLHIYVNGRMATMITIDSGKKVVTLHHLSKGKDVISFVQANPLTHQAMGNDMAGMEMSNGNMGDMGGGNSKMGHTQKDKNPIEKRLVVYVQ